MPSSRFALSFLLLLISVAVLPGRSFAQSDDRAWEECKKNPEPDWVIFNCTAVVEGAGERSASRRARALILRAQALVRKKEVDRARRDFNRAVETAGFNADILVGRGDFLLSQNEIEAAKADYDAALAIEPKTTKALFGLAMVSRQRGDYAGGVAYLDKVLAQDPRFPRARALVSEWRRAAPKPSTGGS